MPLALSVPLLLGAKRVLASRADILRRLGRVRPAAEAYRRALALTGEAVENRYLRRRLAELGEK
jgi:RNA polymerase sigma-70 factor, ECF subfamily